MTPITNFFKNKSVFVTGGTGFLGKVLIEKLLYSCRDIDSIYMHIKPKHGKDIEERMVELFNSPVFQRIQKENPTALKKIIPIAGNLRDENMGISSRDLLTLSSEVSIVFHSAASVKLDFNLVSPIEINTKGTQTILKLCKEMRNFKSFVYISTAYCNCPNKIIEEKVYKTGTSLENLYDFLNSANYSDYKKLVGKRPNAYTYSKGLAEEVIANTASDYDMPASIVRPSFILSAIKEPVPGWVENWYATNAIISGSASGVLRSCIGDPSIVLGMVPVDYVANLCIAVAWDTHRRRENGEKSLKVFNYCSGIQNPITQKDFVDCCLRQSKNIVKYMGPEPKLYITTNRYKFRLTVYLMETIPFFFVRIWEIISGEKSKSLQFHEYMQQVRSVCEYFMSNEFKFIDTNTKQLFKNLDKNDVERFDFNVKSIKWDEYIKGYVTGLNKYLMKRT